MTKQSVSLNIVLCWFKVCLKLVLLFVFSKLYIRDLTIRLCPNDPVALDSLASLDVPQKKNSKPGSTNIPGIYPKRARALANSALPN